MTRSISLESLKLQAGRELGLSSWREVDQTMIDRFAEVTGDRQFIHVDPARAAETPFGGTIAHGFLSLALLSVMSQEALPEIRQRRIAINYGFDRVRFLTPVSAGSRVRGRFTLAEATMRSESEALIRYAVTVEIEGAAKPALVAQWLTLALLK